jgi:hypothetical protein
VLPRERARRSERARPRAPATRPIHRRDARTGASPGAYPRQDGFAERLCRLERAVRAHPREDGAFAGMECRPERAGPRPRTATGPIQSPGLAQRCEPSGAAALERLTSRERVCRPEPRRVPAPGRVRGKAVRTGASRASAPAPPPGLEVPFPRARARISPRDRVRRGAEAGASPRDARPHQSARSRSARRRSRRVPPERLACISPRDRVRRGGEAGASPPERLARISPRDRVWRGGEAGASPVTLAACVRAIASGASACTRPAVCRGGVCARHGFRLGPSDTATRRLPRRRVCAPWLPVGSFRHGDPPFASPACVRAIASGASACTRPAVCRGGVCARHRFRCVRLHANPPFAALAGVRAILFASRRSQWVP